MNMDTLSTKMQTTRVTTKLRNFPKTILFLSVLISILSRIHGIPIKWHVSEANLSLAKIELLHISCHEGVLV